MTTHWRKLHRNLPRALSNSSLAVMMMYQALQSHHLSRVSKRPCRHRQHPRSPIHSVFSRYGQSSPNERLILLMRLESYRSWHMSFTITSTMAGKTMESPGWRILVHPLLTGVPTWVTSWTWSARTRSIATNWCRVIGYTCSPASIATESA